jgi:protein TonB
MTTPFNSEENFNELIFEDRNKEYGAYALRRSYGNTVTRSMIISLSAVTLLVFAVSFFGKGVDKISSLGPNILPPIPSVITVDITPTKPKITEKIIPKDPNPPKTQTGNLTASDEKDKTIDKTNDQLTIAKVNNDNGSDSLAVDPVVPQKTDPPVEDDKAKYYVDVMPEFDGNVYQFIKNNLRYPQMAVDNRTEGTVGLSFIIEKDGSIGEINVLRDIGDGCAKEAVRVLKSMPKWKPGLNHGQPVRVFFTLPVKFTLGK